MADTPLPSSLETEQAVLGCILSNKENLVVCLDILQREDFYHEQHKTIFSSAYSLHQQGKPVDVHILANDLKSSGALDSIGGIPYIISLCQSSQLSAYIEEYCAIIKSKRILRDIIHQSDSASTLARANPPDPESLLDDIQKNFCSISFGNDKSLGVTISDIINGRHVDSALPYIDVLQHKINLYKADPSKPQISGLQTGYEELDTVISGFNKSNLIILSACTSVGKTALALNIAEHMACNQNIPVGIFSLEMTSDQLFQRILCSQSGVPSEALVTGNITDVQLQKIQETLPKLESCPIIIDDRCHPKIHELRSKARRLKSCHGIKLLIVDYLTLIEPSTSRASDNRQTDVASISRSLKLLSRELDIPILCLAQLSRKVDDRPSHRPVLGDLRESGAIEHDADVVLFLYRRDYYDKADRPGEAEIIIAKNRQGAIGSVRLRYSKETCTFSNPDFKL